MASTARLNPQLAPGFRPGQYGTGLGGGDFGGQTGFAAEQQQRLEDYGTGLRDRGIAGRDREVAYDPSQAGESRGGQTLALGDLEAMRAAAGPSLAQAQLRQGAQAAMAGNTSLARGAARGGVAQALRQAAFQNAQVGQQTNQQAQVVAAQEAQAQRARDLAALRAAQGAYGQMRGQDIAQGAYASDLAMQNAQANDAYLIAMGQAGLGAEQQGMGYAGSQANLNRDLEAQRMQRIQNQKAADQQRDAAGMNAAAQGGTTLMGMGMMMSDARRKQNVRRY